MPKWNLISLALIVSSCGQAGSEKPTPSKEEPTLIIAAQSVSLEFPLQFDGVDAPPGYIKVGAVGGRNETGEHLVDALVLCSPDLAWIEKTSHSMAVIMPSDENAIWNGVDGWRPSDEDIIACIRQSVGGPFFYRKLPNGIDTYHQK